MRAAKLSLLSLGLIACSDPPDPPPPPDAVIAVAITSPAPGSELIQPDAETITVTGTVATDQPDQGKLEAYLNGVQIEVVNGAFTAELTPEPGVNHIKVEGGDGLGRLVAQELDVMWAPDYLVPLAGQTGFDLTGALELELGQRFFDARLLGTTLDVSTNPVIARDLASALELILRHVDLAGLLPGGIHIGEGGAALDVNITSARPASIVVDAKIVTGNQPGLELNIDLNGVFLGTSGQFTFSNTTLVVAGGLTADLHAAAKLTLGRNQDGSINVEVGDVTAAIGPLNPAFTGANGEALNGLIETANSSFRGLVVNLVTTELIPTFTDRVPPLLETLLGTADKLLDNINFTLDPGLGTPVTLQLDGAIGRLDIAAGATAGHVTVSQDLAIRTTGAPIHPGSRGAPRLDPLAGEAVLDTSGVHLTMREDFLNALLHALWNAGLLEGPVSFGGLSAEVSAKLPPVIRPTPASSPCKVEGERCDVILELGQLEVSLPGLAQSFAINASAGARILVDGGTVSLAIQEVPDLRVWETSAVHGTLDANTVRDLIANLVWPGLFGTIGDKLTISLPLPSLEELGLGDLAPGLADAQLQLQMRRRPSVAAGRLLLGADLELATPPPPAP